MYMYILPLTGSHSLSLSLSLSLIHFRPRLLCKHTSCLTTECVCLCVFQPGPIAELDGSVSGDFFTVLCVSQAFAEDQWMNVHSFSMLRHWLLTYHSVTDGNMSQDAGMTSSLTPDLEGREPSDWFIRIWDLNVPLCFYQLHQTNCCSVSPCHTLTVRCVCVCVCGEGG